MHPMANTQCRAIVVAAFLTLVVASDGRAQNMATACAAARRPASYTAVIAPVDTGLSALALDPLIPLLMSRAVVSESSYVT